MQCTGESVWYNIYTVSTNLKHYALKEQQTDLFPLPFFAESRAVRWESTLSVKRKICINTFREKKKKERKIFVTPSSLPWAIKHFQEREENFFHRDDPKWEGWNRLTSTEVYVKYDISVTSSFAYNTLKVLSWQWTGEENMTLTNIFKILACNLIWHILYPIFVLKCIITQP